MTLRRLMTQFAAILSLSMAGACAAKPAAPPAVSADVWAVVDGRDIRRDDVEKAYRGGVDLAATPSDEEAMAAKLSLLNEMITQDLLMAKAKSLAIEVTGAEIETAFNERKKNIADDVFQKQISQRGLTTADVKENLRRELTVQKVIDHEVSSKITVSEQAVVDYFNANRGQFSLSEPAYHIAQIVITPAREPQIANRQNDDAATPEAAARKIKMITDRLSGGTAFNELAMDYSEDPQTAPQGGDLGFVAASQLAQAAAPLRDAVLKLQPGGVSQVSAGGGYTLVMLVAKEAAGQRDLSSPGVRDNISGALRDRQQQLLQTAYLTVVRNDAQVVNQLAKQIVARPPTAPAVAPALPAAPGKK